MYVWDSTTGQAPCQAWEYWVNRTKFLFLRRTQFSTREQVVAVSSTFFSVEVSFIKGNNNKGKWLLVEEKKKRKIAGTVEFVCLKKKMSHFCLFLNQNSSLLEITQVEEEREKAEGKRERKRKGKEVTRGKGKPEREQTDSSLVVTDENEDQSGYRI